MARIQLAAVVNKSNWVYSCVHDVVSTPGVEENELGKYNRSIYKIIG